MTDRELFQQTLDAMHWAAQSLPYEITAPFEKGAGYENCACPICVAIKTVATRLAQPEPVWEAHGGVSKINWQTPEAK